MRELIAGEGGSVLVAGATSPDAVALACEGLAAPASVPSGVPVYPIDAIPDDLQVDRVRLVACERATRARFESLSMESPRKLPRPEGVRVVAVSATSTGSGKTALTRRVARTLIRSGVRAVVVRHPIANMLHWGWSDASVVRLGAELDGPLEVREELAPLLGTRVPVVVGLDPHRLLEVAAREGDVIVWDGGGAAEPWIECDLHLVAVDALRNTSIRPADAYVITKADSAGDRARDVEEKIRAEDRDVPIVLADLLVGVQPTNVLLDKRVVIVEDWASLVLGELSAGAGAVAAKRFRCGVVDPRPFAVGAVAETLKDHPHIGAVIPSIGRTEEEIADLARSVYATPGDVVLWASNADPSGVIPDEQRPVVRAFGELTEVAGSGLQQLLAPLLPGH